MVGTYWGRGPLISLGRCILALARRGDVVHAHGTRAAMGAMLANAVRSGLRTVYTVHGFHGLAQRGRFGMLKLVMLSVAGPTLVALALICRLAPQLLALFASSFADAWGALVLLALGTAANALGGPTGYTLQLAGEERRFLRVMAAVYAVVTALQFVVIPAFGLMGAAALSLGGRLAWNLWARSICRRRLGVDPTVLMFFSGPAPAPADAVAGADQ